MKLVFLGKRVVEHRIETFQKQVTKCLGCQDLLQEKDNFPPIEKITASKKRSVDFSMEVIKPVNKSMLQAILGTIGLLAS